MSRLRKFYLALFVLTTFPVAAGALLLNTIKPEVYVAQAVEKVQP